MIIKIKDLHPNPFRDIDNYPMDAEKIEALKESIDQTGFWDNLVVRKNGKGYQLAYGHHRLEALKQLKVKEVDLPVRDLSDVIMLQMMANENRDEYAMSPIVMNETIRVVRDFLNAELRKKDPHISLRILFDTEHSLTQAQTHGVGENTILKFLGSSWKVWRIRLALEQIKAIENKEVSEEAINVLGSQSVASKFVIAVKAAKISIKEQLPLAEKIVNDDVGKRNVGQIVSEAIYKTQPAKAKVIQHLDEVADKMLAASEKFKITLSVLVELLELGNKLSPFKERTVYRSLEDTVKKCKNILNKGKDEK